MQSVWVSSTAMAVAVLAPPSRNDSSPRTSPRSCSPSTIFWPSVLSMKISMRPLRTIKRSVPLSPYSKMVSTCLKSRVSIMCARASRSSSSSRPKIGTSPIMVTSAGIGFSEGDYRRAMQHSVWNFPYTYGVCGLKESAVHRIVPHDRKRACMKIQLLGEHLAHDIRYALRGLARNRMFTLTAVMVIALGIGACTAVFSAVDRILFRSLPYFEDQRMVSVGLTAPIERHEFMLGRQYVDWRDRQKPFAALTSWSGVTDCDLTSEPPVRLGCAHVEANFLSVFGVSPFAGASFTSEEDRPNGPRVALISYGLWQGRFGADPKILGQQIPLDGTSTIVIGVLPQSFELPTLTPAQVLVPQALDEAAQRTSTQGAVLAAFARLKRGVTMAQAEAQLQSLLSDLMQFVPPQFRNEVKLKIRYVRDRQIEDFKTASWLLLGAVPA